MCRIPGRPPPPYNFGAVDGLEVLRLTGGGTVGIGPTFNSSLQPQARLHVFDDLASHGTYYNGLPQLRLSQQLNTNPTLGRWTDFTVTANGDLHIHPFNGTVDRFVGVNSAAPGNTVHINSGITAPGGGRDIAGLRFTNLRAVASPAPVININPFMSIGGQWPAVLTVDANGDVSLTDDLGGANMALCGLATTDINFVSKWTDVTHQKLCPTIIYDNGSNVGVGTGNTPSAAHRLQVSGDLVIGHANDNGNVWKRNTATGTIQRVFSVEGLTNFSNIAISPDAGPPLTTLAGASFKAYCTYLGYRAGMNDIGTGYANTFLGNQAGENFSGNAGWNTFVGSGAGNLLASGQRNVIIGSALTHNLTSGDYNVIAGWNAGSQMTNTGNSIYIGRDAGINIGGGNNNNNIMLGYLAGNFAGGGRSNAVAIGAFSRVDCNDCMVLGANDNNTINHHVGIGVNNPMAGGMNAKLVVTGPFLPAALLVNNRVGMDWNTGFPQMPDNQAELTVRSNGGAGVPNSAHFYGNAFYNGTILITSDSLIKMNFSTIGNALTKLDSLNGFTYNFDTTNYGYLGLGSGLNAGFKAQDVEKVFPELVNEMTAGKILDSLGNTVHQEMKLKAINYIGLIPYLVQAVKELKSGLGAAKNTIDTCCASKLRMPGSEPQQSSIGLQDIQSIRLDQNDPNPFGSNTIIRWHIPDAFGAALIYFFDNSGHQINSYEIKGAGPGELQVFGSKLSTGVYTYTLVVDGQMIESRKMVKAGY